MHLSIPDHFSIDEIVKSFEVAYRSSIVETLKNAFENKEAFLAGIDKILANTGHTTLINSNKYDQKLKTIKSKLEKNYSVICDCFIAYQSKTYNDNDVPYVSALVDYVELFFNPYFAKSELLKTFTPTEFIFYSERYHFLRNALSHPAASNILITDVNHVILFIKRLLANLDDKYFWYVSKFDIKNKIDKFNSVVSNPDFEDEGVPLITFSLQKDSFLLESEAEIAILLQDITRGYQQNGKLIFEVSIQEENQILLEMAELKKDQKDVKKRKRISDLKDIVFYFNKIKTEIKFKLSSIILLKLHEGYSSYSFAPFAKLASQLMARLWEIEMIYENTIIDDIFEVELKRRKPFYPKGMKLDIMNGDESIIFCIFEPEEKVKKLYESRSTSKSISFNSRDMPIMFQVLGLEVSHLDFDIIISKVFFAFIEKMYDKNPNIVLDNSINLTSFYIGIG